VFSSYKYATADIIRSLIHLFEIVFPTVYFVRSSAVSLPTYSVGHSKQKTNHTLDNFIFLSLAFDFSFGSFYIITRKTNYGYHFISSSSSYRHRSTFKKMSVFPNNFYNNNHTSNQLVNVSMLVEKPCPLVSPVVVTYFHGSPVGWNAVVYIYI
jgi:hypothetical protein